VCVFAEGMDGLEEEEFRSGEVMSGNLGGGFSGGISQVP